MSARKFFVGGNFKMNGSVESVKSLVSNLVSAKLDPNTETVIAPSSLYLLLAKEIASSSSVQVSAQNAYPKDFGAFTGEISIAQLADAGIPWVILGHSERRSLFHETDEFVADKTAAALSKGLKVMVCVGETLEEREKGVTQQVVERQLEAVWAKINDWSHVVIAYEPVWAIGTGKVATAQQAQVVHSGIRTWLSSKVSPQVAESTRIIYGGSVAAKNCKELAAEKDIDGFLVGGASLKPEFVDIVNCNA